MTLFLVYFISYFVIPSEHLERSGRFGGQITAQGRTKITIISLILFFFKILLDAKFTLGSI